MVGMTDRHACMTARHVLVEVDGDIATITLDRPEKRNALALDVMVELTEAFEHVGTSDALGVVLAANGPVFSAGHNFGDMAGASIDDARHLFAVCTTLMDTVQSIPQPVVARVHALATAAGCQLVATCDLAVAAQSASFAIPGGKGGLFCHTPLVAVARNIGRKRALEMALTGDPIDATIAAEWGLDQPSGARRRTRRRRPRPDHPGDAGQCVVEGARQAWLLRPDRRRPAVGVRAGRRSAWPRRRWSPTPRRRSPRSSTSATRRSCRARTTGRRRPSADPDARLARRPSRREHRGADV